MKYLIQKFRKSSITKQYAILLICSFLLMFFLSILILIQARQAITQIGNEYASMLSGTLSTELATISAQAESICEQLLYGTDVTALLEADAWSDVDIKIIDELKTQKAYLSETNSSIADITFISSLVYWTSLYEKNTLLDMADSVANTKAPVCLGIQYATFHNAKNTPYLVFGVPAYAKYQLIGYIFVSIHLPQISSPTVQRDDANAIFLMVDENYNTYAFNCEQSLANEIIQESGLKKTLFTPNTLETRSNIILRDYAVSYQYVKSANCYIISAVNTNNVSRQLYGINLLCGTIISVTILLLLFVYLCLYKNYIAPIRNFNFIIKKIEANHQRTIKEPLHLQGCAEIQEIGDSFSSLLSSINNLNRQIVRNANDLYEMELQQKTAELNYLRSQINPHFIYNTLELIRGIATDYDTPQIGQLTVSMGKILRYSIKGEPIVPLQQEIDITLAYLHIQQARFPNRFTILTNFQPDTTQIPVLKMLLQPLVENAIFHGLEPKEGNGIIFLNSTLTGKFLKITIRDNGVGISEKKLSRIQYSLASPIYDTSQNIGLVNTNARIRLQYGSAYGISLESTEGDGTCVTLQLPSGKQTKKQTKNQD